MRPLGERQVGLISSHANWHDAKYKNGTPVEIKSTMRHKSDGKGGTNPGEFRIFKDVHDRLGRSDGYYVFVCYRPRGNGVKVLKSKRVHARNLPYFAWNKLGHQTKQGALSGYEVLMKVRDIFG